MIKVVSFHPMAETELNEAAQYYNLRKNGLGAKFISEIERAVKITQLNPESAPIILKSVRRKVLGRFPYSMMYTASDDVINILAIANQKRRPFYWRNRI